MIARGTRMGALVVAAAVAVALAATRGAAQEPSGGGTPVAARTLPRGAALAAEDVVGDPAALEGWVTRRVISEGEALREPAIAPPDLVTAGEVVQVVWKHGGIELRLVGRATSSGALGERVQVRVDSRRRFAGLVVDRALVRMEAGDNRK